jgi:hypothetical protein
MISDQRARIGTDQPTGRALVKTGFDSTAMPQNRPNDRLISVITRHIPSSTAD